MGLHEGGMAAGITNFRSVEEVPRSRGRLVLDVLTEGSVNRARSFLEGLDTAEFRPFNLWFGDGESLFVGYARTGKPLVMENVEPGVHILANDKLGVDVFDRERKMHELTSICKKRSAQDIVSQLRSWLADHAGGTPSFSSPPAYRLADQLEEKIAATCVHTSEYGTCSSTIVLAGQNEVQYFFAPGPPCSASFSIVERVELT